MILRVDKQLYFELETDTIVEILEKIFWFNEILVTLVTIRINVRVFLDTINELLYNSEEEPESQGS